MVTRSIQRVRFTHLSDEEAPWECCSCGARAAPGDEITIIRRADLRGFEKFCAQCSTTIGSTPVAVQVYRVQVKGATYWVTGSCLKEAKEVFDRSESHGGSRFDRVWDLLRPEDLDRVTVYGVTTRDHSMGHPTLLSEVTRDPTPRVLSCSEW